PIAVPTARRASASFLILGHSFLSKVYGDLDFVIASVQRIWPICKSPWRTPVVADRGQINSLIEKAGCLGNVRQVSPAKRW
ncbi:MAG: hypothetical protein WA730_12315, partial [Pseudolabrys sp.]